MTQPNGTPADDVTFTQVKIFARNQIHAYLGISELRATLYRMEQAMAKEAEQFAAVLSKLTDVHADVRAKLDEVRAETSPEGQAKLDEVVAAIDAFDTEIGDADKSDTPPAPVEPPAPVGPPADPNA